MTRSPSPPWPDARPPLEREREVLPLPPAVRARALARARAALVAGLAAIPPSMTAPRLGRAGTVALVCLASVAVSAVGYQIGVHLASARSASPAAPHVEARRATADVRKSRTSP